MSLEGCLRGWVFALDAWVLEDFAFAMSWAWSFSHVTLLLVYRIWEHGANEHAER